MAIENVELMHSVIPNTCEWEQQDWNQTIKDKGEEGKMKWMNVKRSKVGTEKSRQPKRQKSLNLFQVMSVTHDSLPLYLFLTANDKSLQAGQRAVSGVWSKWLFLNLFKLESNIISVKKCMLMEYFGK